MNTESEADKTQGVVVRSTGSWYEVRLPDGTTRQARMRGKFRLDDLDETNPLAVGDRVVLREDPDGTALITEILPRHNQLSRRAAGRRSSREHVLVANVDHVWCVQAADLPAFNPGFVDRVLVVAEAYHIPAGILLNKVDLAEGNDEVADDVAFWSALYRNIGYPVIETSALRGDGVEAIREALHDQTSVLTGASGVGKSALLNAVDPTLDLRTGAVSQRTRKGKHTTTYYTLYPLAFGGFIIDTPGIREFGLWGIAPEELGGYFIEMRPLVGQCRYPDCTHDHEPGCAVMDAVERDEIPAERYRSYLNILESLRAGSEDTGR